MTQRDGVDYNLAYIEPDFPDVKHEDFDPAYMRPLFDYAYAKGRRGIPGTRHPLTSRRRSPSSRSCWRDTRPRAARNNSHLI
jgi:hypothetical protein